MWIVVVVVTAAVITAFLQYVHTADNGIPTPTVAPLSEESRATTTTSTTDIGSSSTPTSTIISTH